MEVGTEEFPYTSKLTITMHGDRTTPEIAIFGSKVIGVYQGQLEMHGPVRNPTWCQLNATAEIGSN